MLSGVLLLQARSCCQQSQGQSKHRAERAPLGLIIQCLHVTKSEFEYGDPLAVLQEVYGFCLIPYSEITNA